MRRKVQLEERPIFNAVTVFRERGNYLQRLEQFEKSILAYNEALRWNKTDVRSLLGRSLARVKATHYYGALEDAVHASELEPENCKALQIRAQTEYEKSAFEQALVLAHRGVRVRRCPPDFAECLRCAEETVRECVGNTATKILTTAASLVTKDLSKRKSLDDKTPKFSRRLRIESQQVLQVQEISRAEKQKAEQISRVMGSKYLERMAHDKYFLTALCKDERLVSANKQGSQKLQELANKALADVKKREEVLRERRPLYAARASEEAARRRLSTARKQQIKHTQIQHETDARRLIQIARNYYEERDTNKCLEHAEFGMDQISKKATTLLPNKDKFLLELYNIVANAFLDQKRVQNTMSESDREQRAFVLLGMTVSREPSNDSVLRVRPPAPPRDVKIRLRNLERSLTTCTRRAERCYLLHELARLYIDIRQSMKARYYAHKCQSESKTSNQRVWLLNALFLLARCHLLQNNRPEARAILLEGAGLARCFGFEDVAEFYDTCVNVSLEGDMTAAVNASIEKRRKDLVNLMQDDDLKSEAQHLFKRMSLVPASSYYFQVRECVGNTATKILTTAASLVTKDLSKRKSLDDKTPKFSRRLRIESQQVLQVQEISRAEKQKAEQISRVMGSKYLERMAHDKYFLTALCKDERLVSANKQGSQKLQELANKALADVKKREEVLRERRPLYAARASEEAARRRLSTARKQQIKHTQIQHETDARRLIQIARNYYEERDTNKCLEHAEFGMDQISKKATTLLPNKDKFLLELYNIVANAFLDQKRVQNTMSESDREQRAFVLLGMTVSREPSNDSVLRVRPPAPPRDVKIRLRNLERSLTTCTRRAERCYLLHELARLYIDIRQSMKARYYAHKCQSESKTSNQRVWLLNALFLLARCHLLQNNRPEARAILLEGAGLARCFGFEDVAEFYDTCVNVSLEGDMTAAVNASIEKRRKDLVNLMQDDDLKSEAQHLFKRMSLVPASRRFSILPGTHVEVKVAPSGGKPRQSIIPKGLRPTKVSYKSTHPLGFQEFDI